MSKRITHYTAVTVDDNTPCRLNPVTGLFERVRAWESPTVFWRTQYESGRWESLSSLRRRIDKVMSTAERLYHKVQVSMCDDMPAMKRAVPRVSMKAHRAGEGDGGTS